MNTQKKRILCIVVMLFSVMIIYYFDIGCLFYKVFGIPCAGCGMTRAFIAALHLDFQSAFKFHPLVFITPFMTGVFIFSDRFEKKHLIIFWPIVVLLFIYVYFIKLFGTS